MVILWNFGIVLKITGVNMTKKYFFLSFSLFIFCPQAFADDFTVFDEAPSGTELFESFSFDNFDLILPGADSGTTKEGVDGPIFNFNENEPHVEESLDVDDDTTFIE